MLAGELTTLVVSNSTGTGGGVDFISLALRSGLSFGEGKLFIII